MTAYSVVGVVAKPMFKTSKPNEERTETTMF